MELFRRLRIPDVKSISKSNTIHAPKEELIRSSSIGNESPPVTVARSSSGAQDKIRERDKAARASVPRGKQPIAPKSESSVSNNSQKSNKPGKDSGLSVDTSFLPPTRSSRHEDKSSRSSRQRDGTKCTTVQPKDTYLPPQIQGKNGKGKSSPKRSRVEKEAARRKADPPGNVKRKPSVTTNSSKQQNGPLQENRPVKPTKETSRSKCHSPSAAKRRLRRGNTSSPRGASNKPKVGKEEVESDTPVTASNLSHSEAHNSPKLPNLQIDSESGGSVLLNQSLQTSPPSIQRATVSTISQPGDTPWTLQSPSGADTKRPVLGSLLGRDDVIGELDEMNCPTPRTRNHYLDVDGSNAPSWPGSNDVRDATPTCPSLAREEKSPVSSVTDNDAGLSRDQPQPVDANEVPKNDSATDGAASSSPSRSEASIRRRRHRSTSRSRNRDQQAADRDASSTGERSSSSPRNRPRRRSRSRSRSRSGSRTRSVSGQSSTTCSVVSSEAPSSPTGRRPGTRSPKSGPPVTKRTPAQKLSMKYAMKAADLDIAPTYAVGVTLSPVATASRRDPLVRNSSNRSTSSAVDVERINVVDGELDRTLESNHDSSTHLDSSPPESPPTNGKTKKLDPMRALLKRIPSATGLGSNTRGLLKRCSSFSGLHKRPVVPDSPPSPKDGSPANAAEKAS